MQVTSTDYKTWKYRDNPEYKIITKEKLRSLVFSEYHRLNNFDTYRRMRANQHCTWPYNLNHSGPIPSCIGNKLYEWVDQRYDHLVNVRCRNMKNKFAHDSDNNTL